MEQLEFPFVKDLKSEKEPTKVDPISILNELEKTFNISNRDNLIKDTTII